MGLEIEKDEFGAEDYARFAVRLREQLATLRELLTREGFGVGPATVGAELEMFLVDAQGRPVHRNEQVLRRTKDPRVTLELGRFNMEGNARPLPLAGRPFSGLAVELRQLEEEVRRAALSHQAKVAVIGILPTLTPSELGQHSMTDRARYRALAAGILGRREEAPLRVRIDGADPLDLEWDAMTLQGANTSFQVHLRVAPEDFARTYNAAQLAMGPALALCGNSPFFLGHALWEETRIALFKHATDDRADVFAAEWRSPARTSFGSGWVRQGAAELFEASVALHAPLLPVCAEEEHSGEGEAPALAELRLHHGTVWTWNRAVYDPAGGGHLRIELRALPAGPTVEDMVANAALVLGLTLGLAEEVDGLLPAMPFAYAERNFYQGAKRGLAAQLLWPSPEAPSPREVAAPSLLTRLLPVAARGLARAGVEAGEIDHALGILSERLAAEMTGARWQRERVEALGGARDLGARRKMLEEYLALSQSDVPVHRWPR